MIYLSWHEIFSWIIAVVSATLLAREYQRNEESG